MSCASRVRSEMVDGLLRRLERAVYRDGCLRRGRLFLTSDPHSSVEAVCVCVRVYIEV